MTIFPDDENGRVLRNIAAKGDDLTKARDIDFAVVFAQASSAEQFAEHFRGLGYKVTVEEAGTQPDHPWDLVVVKHMVPPTKASPILRTSCNLWPIVGAG